MTHTPERIHVIPVGDTELHCAQESCACHPIEDGEPGVWVHNAFDCREKYERADGEKHSDGWVLIGEEPAIGTTSLPYSTPCPKCGSGDVHRRFFAEGENTHRRMGGTDDNYRRTTAWVDRKKLCNPALRDVIIHTCRCCGHSWDGDPIKEDPS